MLAEPDQAESGRAESWHGARLTRTGLASLICAAALVVAALALGYPELGLVGLALIGALLIGFTAVSRRPAVNGSRLLVPDRVLEDAPAASRLTLTNRRRRGISAGVVLERIGRDLIPVAMPALGPNQSTIVDVPLPTGRRGVYQIGPLALERTDPFGLFTREGEREPVAELRVYPRIHHVDPYPSGMTRDLDGPNAGEAPEGGITFQNLREYVPGDDRRLIHWRSSARTGTLMVRHNVDHHRPSSMIVLDTRSRVHTKDSFEDAIRAAASVALASHSRGFPFRIRTTCGRSLDHGASRRALLDTFAEMQPTGSSDLASVAQLTRREQGGFSLAVITGRASVKDLAVLGPLRKRFEAMTIVRLGAASTNRTAYLPGAVLLNVGDSAEFARAWQRRVRR